VDFEQLEQEKHLSYMPVGATQGLAEELSAMLAQSTAEVFAARRGLLLTCSNRTAVSCW